MMNANGQSALEWLMTHSWAVIVILLVGLTLAHLGFFEASARPRFEGLRAAGIQPIPGEVHLYSDGILVLTVQNTRPYSMRHEWVEIAPISNPEDRIRTTINGLLGQGDVGVYTINASNLAGTTAASILLTTSSEAKTTYTDFLYSHQETHVIPGGSPQTKTYTDAKAIQITTYSTAWVGETGSHSGCERHVECSCNEKSDCSLDCQDCIDNVCDNYFECSGAVGNTVCWPTESSPNGECIVDNMIDCTETDYCPLLCQECSAGICIDLCEPMGCTYDSVAAQEGACM